MSLMKPRGRASGHARAKAARIRRGDPPGSDAALERMREAYQQLRDKHGPVYDKMRAKQRAYAALGMCSRCHYRRAESGHKVCVTCRND